MTRSQQQIIVLGVLGCVMAAVYARALRPSASRRSPPAKAAAEQAATPASHPDERAGEAARTVSAALEWSEQRREQRARAAELAWERDPFARGRAAGAVGGFTLSGILWDASAPIAIINGQMVHVGEELDGYRIVSIAQDRVFISDGAKTHQLLLTP